MNMKSFWKHLAIDNGELTLIEAGLQKFVPHQLNNYRVRHEAVLHLVIAGSGTYKVNQQTYELKARDGFILKKNHQVFYTPNPDEPWTLAWIGLGGKKLQLFLNNTTLFTQDTYTFQEDSLAWQEMTDLIDWLSYSDLSNQRDYLLAFSRLYQMLLTLNLEFSDYQTQENSYMIPEANLAEKVYDYIYENFLNNLTITHIAEHFDISRNYLFKICKEYYGQSPKNMIQELRMNQAVQLLRGSPMQVKEIASLVGYKDAFSFSKMFSKYHDYSPTEFRRLSDETYDEVLFKIDEKLRKKSVKKYY